jgi:hypothetical protein
VAGAASALAQGLDRDLPRAYAFFSLCSLTSLPLRALTDVSTQVGANKSTLVTKNSSHGMWLPVHGEEWDGDIPLDTSGHVSPGADPERGAVEFRGDQLPWETGKYEVRLLSLSPPRSFFRLISPICRYGTTTMANTMCSDKRGHWRYTVRALHALICVTWLSDVRA